MFRQMNSYKVDTRSRESNSKPYDSEPDEVPHDKRVTTNFPKAFLEPKDCRLTNKSDDYVPVIIDDLICILNFQNKQYLLFPYFW